MSLMNMPLSLAQISDECRVSSQKWSPLTHRNLDSSETELYEAANT